jgi:ribosomal-protein-alanine N-acetyltransferase
MAFEMISNHNVTLAAIADALPIALLSRDEIEFGLRWSWTERRVRRAIADPDTNVIVVRHGGTVAGFALMQYEDERAHLLLLAVDPAARRQGVASALLDWVDVTLDAAGIRFVQVEVRASNQPAIALYAKRGFEQINATRGYYQGRETALHFVRESPASRD